MKMISTFKQPTPKSWLMDLLSPVNKLFLLNGIPIFRDVPLLNKIPGIRGVTSVRTIDFPKEDQQKLKLVSGDNNATFFLPNHPEFFTDWMIDKYILSKVAPKSASWATADIVNGMGRRMQKFWLNNNLIAQVPGQSHLGKEYSIVAAGRGEGVLLHPEGQVSWYGNHIAPLFSGAAEMAIEAYRNGSVSNAHFKSWLAPVIWKLRFNQDVQSELLHECDYVEKRLEIDHVDAGCAAQRVYQIYLKLAKRDYYKNINSSDSFADMHLSEYRNGIINKSRCQLGKVVEVQGLCGELALRRTNKWLRLNEDHKEYNQIKTTVKVYKRWLRLKNCSFESIKISQEEVAEHLKRIRADFCGGSVRDMINKYMPQAVGQRTAHIRTVEPIAIHQLISNQADISPAKIMLQVRKMMQKKLDALNAELERGFEQFKVFNPFHFEKQVA